MPRYTDTQAFYRCTSPRCNIRFWPVEAGPNCPGGSPDGARCGMPGLYVGIAVKEWDPTPEEEQARTVQPITEHEHAPPEEPDA